MLSSTSRSPTSTRLLRTPSSRSRDSSARSRAGGALYIAYNSTANSSIVACASTLKSSLTALGKSVNTITLSNYTCAGSSDPALVGTNCLNGILSSSKPIIILSQGRNSSIIYKGLYGIALYATGSAAVGSSCMLNSVLNYK